MKLRNTGWILTLTAACSADGAWTGTCAIDDFLGAPIEVVLELDVDVQGGEASGTGFVDVEGASVDGTVSGTQAGGEIDWAVTVVGPAGGTYTVAELTGRVGAGGVRGTCRIQSTPDDWYEGTLRLQR
ncbi:MAG: hypothetical protein RLZZ383_1944 [Pseudomonadota bacterium]|jgi:hypothetical protein